MLLVQSAAPEGPQVRLLVPLQLQVQVQQRQAPQQLHKLLLLLQAAALAVERAVGRRRLQGR